MNVRKFQWAAIAVAVGVCFAAHSAKAEDDADPDQTAFNDCCTSNGGTLTYDDEGNQTGCALDTTEGHNGNPDGFDQCLADHHVPVDFPLPPPRN